MTVSKAKLEIKENEDERQLFFESFGDGQVGIGTLVVEIGSFRTIFFQNWCYCCSFKLCRSNSRYEQGQRKVDGLDRIRSEI